MIFSARHLIELPYVMNLEDGHYDFLYENSILRVFVNNDLYALTTMANSCQFTSAISTKEILQPHLNDSFSLVKTRTILSFYTIYETNEILEASKDELRDSMRSSMHHGGDYPSEDDGEKALKSLNETELQKLKESISIKKTAEKIFPPTLALSSIELFNHFIRTYSIHFNDLFAEEISLYQVGASLTNGVLVQLFFNDEHITSIPVLGLVPPIFRSPLFTHNQDQTSEFKNKLLQVDAVNKSSLLLIRAKHLKTRNMYRSATLEASASIENYVRIKLEKQMAKKNLTEEKISLTLSTNKSFEVRCKKLFAENFSKSIPDIAPLEWQKVKEDRDTIRHKTAHTSYEPSENEVSAMITNIESLMTKVNAFTDKNENTN